VDDGIVVHDVPTAFVIADGRPVVEVADVPVTGFMSSLQEYEFHSFIIL